MAKIDHLITAVEALVEAQHALSDRVLDLEKPAIEHEGAPVAAQVAASPKRTRVVSASPELQALRGQIKRQSKANLVDRCAGHSPAALNTFMLAGSKAAREYMRGARQEAKSLEEFALVPGSAAHQYASAIAGGASPKVTATPKAKARTRATPKGKPTAENGKALSAGMTDAQLLKSRPSGASQAPAAIRTWLWRTRERIAGRDPMRAKA